ncbi:MAG TPA: HPr family phosphocarrier protein [Bradyrhizobium sp.]|uniref:HPr family phosphocarrier protein n=1 Tax=Bradyrhizobium sp. TaxID=376 RepID=UPI002C7C1E11|nr:HPr family phosphocarrier protein [Bradyrhizobium sp.]HLZ06117.1 HPr family phosphocarrier protein [Bradyrhizobium sp.]
MTTLETSEADRPAFTGNVKLVHAVGMHARPAVKLTKLAKKFQAQIHVRVAGAAEWINAKSVAKIMAMRAAHGSMIEVKASGSDAQAAVAALINLIAADFPDEAA